jgi:hypothetical protein
MNFRTKVRTVRGGDIGLAAAILAVVLLGWLTASGSSGAAPGSGQPVSPAQLSARPAAARPGPGGDGTGNFYVAPRSPALLHH